MGAEGGLAFRETSKVSSVFELGLNVGRNPNQLKLIDLLRRTILEAPKDIEVKVTLRGRQLMGWIGVGQGELIFDDTVRRDLIEIVGGPNKEKVRQILAGYIKGATDRGIAKEEAGRQIVEALHAALKDIQDSISRRKIDLVENIARLEVIVARTEDTVKNAIEEHFCKEHGITKDELRKLITWSKQADLAVHTAGQQAQRAALDREASVFALRTRHFSDALHMFKEYQMRLTQGLKSNTQLAANKAALARHNAALSIVKDVENKISLNIRRLQDVERPVINEAIALIAVARAKLQKEARVKLVKIGAVGAALGIIGAFAVISYLGKE